MFKGILVIFLILFIGVGNYIVSSLMIYKVAKNDNYERAWLSFIPLCKEYLVFSLSEQERIFPIFFFTYIVKYLIFFSVLNIGILYFYFPGFTIILYKISLIILGFTFAYAIKSLSEKYNISKILTYTYCVLLIFNGFFANDFQIISTTFFITILVEIIKFFYYIKLYKSSLNLNKNY